jgi:hypothetical protein
MSDDNVYRIKRKPGGSLGQLDFQLALPHDELLATLMNNQSIRESANPDTFMKHIIDMDWKWFEKRIIKFCGDTRESRALQDALRRHIKNEKRWIKNGGKSNDVQLYTESFSASNDQKV